MPVQGRQSLARTWLSVDEKKALVASAQPFEVTSVHFDSDRFGPAFFVELHHNGGPRVLRLEAARVRERDEFMQAMSHADLPISAVLTRGRHGVFLLETREDRATSG